ncbi:MAG TPA: DUF5060 domain-containing protein [Acidobacteriaceae bacterium]|nr:DUF5060 domain-containing protein [Acidobacteriaceae bacterium]
MNRREMMKAGSAVLLTGVASSDKTPAGPTTHSAGKVERWDVFELVLDGPKEGNPFLDTWLKATFRIGARDMAVDGFYDGEGVYRVRFMPDALGEWTYITDSSAPSLKGKTGAFETVAPRAGNHGPIRVRDVYHFGYSDGSPYFPFGTTCYAWVHQSEALQEETLSTLKTSPFNKLRMCIFPKWYQYNHSDPPRFPFPRQNNTNDYSRLNPEYFQHIEKRILDLQALGVEADLILFHPYDHWGFQEMPAEVDDRYLKYVIARFAAYRNVWWSLANEYDLMRKKNPADWDRFAEIVTQNDPYGHLRSIHYSRAPYDYSRVWCTHAGVQSYAFDQAASWRETWRKPLIFDEMMYEGNINSRWGNLSGPEMTRRFWLCIAAGAYGGHGETYVSAADIENDKALLWWSHGGKLKGSSPQRLSFLRRIVEETGTVGGGQIGLTQLQVPYYPSAKRNRDEAFLFYFDFHQPLYYDFLLPDTGKYRAELIDPWAMTVSPVPGEFSGKTRLTLSGQPYRALRFTRI